MIERKQYFKLEESPYYDHRYVIAPNWEELPEMSTSGSFAILGARLLNLSYANYLRMCRDVAGAQIVGKNKTYPVAYFEMSNEVRALVGLLNAAMGLVMWERQHPDWRTHQEYLMEKGKLVNGKDNN